jgi:hypothetical protein
MFAYALRTAALAAAAIVGLSACTSPYGYNGVSVGVGNAGYYDPYYNDGYGYGYGYDAGYSGYGYPGYGFGYAPYWGWNDGFYYPGTGYYVYDHHHHRHHWSDAQRRYWQARRDRAVATGTTTQPVVIRDNWRDFTRDRSAVRSNRVERQLSRPVVTEDVNGQAPGVEGQQDRTVRTERGLRQDRAVRETVQTQRDTVRTERQTARVTAQTQLDTVRTERQAARITAQTQRDTVRTERQTAREQHRSDVRVERTSRGNGRGRGAGSED